MHLQRNSTSFENFLRNFSKPKAQSKISIFALCKKDFHTFTDVINRLEICKSILLCAVIWPSRKV